MGSAKAHLVDWGVPLAAGAFLCEQPHHWLVVWAIIAINIVSRQIGALAGLSANVDALLKTSERTLDRAMAASQDVEFLPRTVERIEGKLFGIDSKLEHVATRVERIRDLVARLDARTPGSDN